MGYICSNPWTTVFIWANGDVTHCCYSNIGPIGNINKNSLEDIFNSSRINYVREQLIKGNYIEAGCEHFCRVYRWNRYYGYQKDIPDIPEGLGRLQDFDIYKEQFLPEIIGIELGGKCNFRCAHCLVPDSKSNGISPENLEKIRPYLNKAKIIRLMGGEFTVNREPLEQLRLISTLSNQPTIFMNTNGFISIDQYLDCIQNLKSFHLKFSLEGMGDDYSRIRTGGNWDTFKANVLRAKEVFEKKNLENCNWKLYLNFCVMKSNFLKIPEVVEFAVENNIRLVLNTINGMRHIDENIFMYDHLKISNKDIQSVLCSVNELIGSDYIFANELKQHLDYIIKTLNDKKLKVPYKLAGFVQSRCKGQKSDRLLYILYKWQLDRKSSLVYLFRKLRKRLLRF